MPETWWEYVTRISANADNKVIGAAAGVDASQVSRWSKGGNPGAQHVVNFARTYKQPPIQALVAAGYLDETDVGGAVAIVQSLAALSDDALIGEVAGRLHRRHETQSGLARVEAHFDSVDAEQLNHRAKKGS